MAQQAALGEHRWDQDAWHLPLGTLPDLSKGWSHRPRRREEIIAVAIETAFGAQHQSRCLESGEF